MILFSERQQHLRLFKVGKKLDTIIAAYSVFNGGRWGGISLFFFLEEMPTSKISNPRNTHKKEFWTRGKPMAKSSGPTKYSQDNILEQ